MTEETQDNTTDEQPDEKEVFAAAICKAVGKLAEQFDEAVTRAIVVGKTLSDAKEAIDRDDWKSWLWENCSMTESYARNYIRLFNEIPKLSDEERYRLTLVPFGETLVNIRLPNLTGNVPGHLTPAEGSYSMSTQEGVVNIAAACIHPADKLPDCYHVNVKFVNREMQDIADKQHGRPVAKEFLLEFLSSYGIDADPNLWLVIEGEPPLEIDGKNQLH